MVWFRQRSKLVPFKRTIKKSIKKFRGSEPDWDYFGGGMYSNYFTIPRKQHMRAYEVFPTLKETRASLEHIVTNSARSFELYKHSDNDHVQLAIRSTIDDIDAFAKSLIIDYRDTGLPILPIISEHVLEQDPQCIFFDFELEQQLNFSNVDTQQKPIIDKLIHAINIKSCGVLIQFLFTTSIKWNSIAAATATNLSRFLQKIDSGKTKHIVTGLSRNLIPTFSTKNRLDVKDRSSSMYSIGKKIEKQYHQKATTSPVSLSIRGMIIGKRSVIRLALENITAVFGSVIFTNDFLRYCDYHVDSDLAYDWILNNDIASKGAIQTLEKNQKMWSDMRWGRGRDFVPFLCLTPNEFSVFVSLPTDPTSPVSFRRQKIRTSNYGKMVFPLGTVL
ncbi:MAG: hypothetical protein WAO91_04670 [Candidatus Nitrosotenuis sp.]